ncbi:hypothetical protein ACP179_00910 (plasmid) [Xenorhabdus stockiae]
MARKDVDLMKLLEKDVCAVCGEKDCSRRGSHTQINRHLKPIIEEAI